MFDFKAAITARPSDAQLPSALGIFHYTDSPAQRGAVIPDASWATQNLVQVDLRQFPNFPRTATGAQPSKLSMHRLVAPVFVATLQEAERRGVLGKLHTYDGCFVPRHMTWDPRRPLSVHSWAAAIDFDAATNGYGVPLSRMRIDLDLVQCFEECGWTWGGRWINGYADGMHFQWSDPLPGTDVQPWQDAMGRSAKVAPLITHRKITLDGHLLAGGPVQTLSTRQVLRGVMFAVQEDGSLWARPATSLEIAGQVGPSATVTGISQRVTLQQADGWLPLVGGHATYMGLGITLDAATGDVAVTSS